MRSVVRHTASGLAIPDFPLSYGRLIPPFFTRQIWIHFTHRVGALLITFMVIWLAAKVSGADMRSSRVASLDVVFDPPAGERGVVN